MIKHFVFAIIAITILSCGRDEPIANYEPKSPEEQALKSVLLEFQNGVNNRDSKQIINLIHDDASIMTGRDRKILSRTEYLKILPKRLAENPPIALGKPKMAISDDYAEVKTYIARGDHKGLIVFNMKRVNDRWYIQSWQY
jgi:hypothetical protein